VRSRSKVPRREPCELEGPEHCAGRDTDEILTDSSLPCVNFLALFFPAVSLGSFLN
jgi:hypothetical protein